jgi:hypothetical protein
MDEDLIFGPLTFRQFLYLGIGAIICYIIFTLWPSTIGYIAMALVAAGAIAGVLNHPRIKIDADYLLKKRANSKNEEAYKRWLKIKIAMLQAQKMSREAKRAPADPEIQTLLTLLEAELAKVGGEPFSLS